MHSARLRRCARRFVLCCLLLAVPVYGLSGRLVELLGHQHVHEGPGAAAGIDPMAGWQDFRRITPAASAGGHGHHHAAFERHHHEHGDPSVVALDAAVPGEPAGEAGTTPAGSAALVFALAGMPAQPAADAAAPAWRAWQAGPLKRRDAERLERPPRG